MARVGGGPGRGSGRALFGQAAIPIGAYKSRSWEQGELWSLYAPPPAPPPRPVHGTCWHTSGPVHPASRHHSPPLASLLHRLVCATAGIAGGPGSGPSGLVQKASTGQLSVPAGTCES